MSAPQGSLEWLAARAGKVTASRIADVLATGKAGAPSLSRSAYMGELIAETLTGAPANPFQGNSDTERGQELEPQARALYEARTGSFVDAVGLVIHPRIDRSGASPDGLVGEGGLLEIKCPRPHVHIGYLLAGKPPSKYIPQMSWQAACTGRSWVDFVSYCPQMPDDLNLFVVRYVPTIDYLQEIEDAVKGFLEELDYKLDAISALRDANSKPKES